MEGTKLDKSFQSDTPVIPDVLIIESWAYHDGPLYGVCKVGELCFFFMNVVYDTWRHYEDGSCERLWSIYGIYDIPIADARKIIGKRPRPRFEWEAEITNESDCIGIFWEYQQENK